MWYPPMHKNWGYNLLKGIACAIKDGPYPGYDIYLQLAVFLKILVYNIVYII